MISTVFLLQLLVVVSPDWDSRQGSLYLFERETSQLDWKLVREPIPVTLGKNGMAWGKGLHPLPLTSNLPKQEGDGRSPAGIFSIGTAFGDPQHQSCAKKISYLLITEDLECVDDPRSKYYNRFVQSSSIDQPDWNSSEKMQEIGPLYALGFVVEHNHNPIVPGDGSAIFFHIWRSPDQGSAGCTTMEESDLKALVEWLDSNSLPRVVQLPLSEYEQRIEEWGLPHLDTSLAN